MMKYRYAVPLILLLLASIANSGDVYVPTGVSTHLSVAQMGMGGLTTTVGTNSHTLFYNPALLNRQDFSLEIAPISGGFDNDAFEILDFVDDHQDEFDNFEDLSLEEQEQFIIDSQSFDSKWVGVQLTPYMGFTSRNYGAGIYGVSHADVKIDQGVFVPAVGLRGYGDLVIGVGTGRVIDIMGKSYELGVTVRFVQRRTLAPMRINAADASDAEEIVETALDEATEDVKSGFGIDAGMIRSFKLDISGRPVDFDYAAVVQDLIGALDGYVKPNVKFGIMAHLPYSHSTYVPGWDVGIELNDFFNRQGVNLFQRINIGTEVSLLSEFVKLRGGFHQGYPTIGASLELYIVSLDYAYFTRELGTKPGLYDEGTHRLQLAFGNY